MKKGQALIEIMIAVSVLTVGFLGIISLLSNSLGINRTVSENYTATYLAAEGIEVVKNILDSNTIQGNSWKKDLGNGVYEIEYDSLVPLQNQDRFLEFDEVSKVFDYSGGSPTKFKRTITISGSKEDEMKVEAEVSWTSRGGRSSTVKIEDHFFNWRKHVK